MTSLNRRQFLRGAGGFTLALPFLPSLLPRSASAQDTVFPKRFVAMATHHGGIWNQNMYPDLSTLTESTAISGQTVRGGALQLETAAGKASLSRVLSADSAALTSSIAEKMMVLQGIDVPWYIAHHTGGHLGNYGRNDGNDPTTGITEFRPTIDQIMAWSPSFYPSLDGVLERSLVIGDGRLSYNWSSPSTRAGEVQDIAAEHSSLALFNRIFVPNEDPTSTRTPVVDRVMENYRRLRNGNRRVSAADKQRLDDHMDRIGELQRRLNTTSNCVDIVVPTVDSRSYRSQSSYPYDPAAMEGFWQLHNDVIAAAFLCNSCRVATMHCGDTFSTFQGDWHQSVAHKANLPAGVEQEVIVEGHQNFFEAVFLDLVKKLDVEEAPGVSMLDNSLVMWSQESGNHTHHSFSLPIVTAGSAGGFFKTGRYADYRNLLIDKSAGENPTELMHPGLVMHNQWLANVCRSMGLSPAEFDLEGNGGYGIFYTQPSANWYCDPAWYNNRAGLGDLMPFIT